MKIVLGGGSSIARDRFSLTCPLKRMRKWLMGIKISLGGKMNRVIISLHILLNLNYTLQTNVRISINLGYKEIKTDIKTVSGLPYKGSLINNKIIYKINILKVS